jgi:hypothetical protein
MAPILSYETQAGQPIRHGEVTLVPFARTLRFLLPRHLQGVNWGFGLAWSRPVSVLAVTDGGQEQVIPVRDVTRQAQLALVGACIGMAIFVGVIETLRTKKPRSNTLRRL